jgi:cytochrome c2
VKNNPVRNVVMLLTLGLPILSLLGCPNDDSKTPTGTIAGSDGPVNQGTPAQRQDGNAAAGRDVFRFDTFGNEGFWTDAVRLPAGIKAAKVTPLQALQLGLNVDVDAVDPAMQQELMKELKDDSSGRQSALLNDPSATGKLIAANAVIGFVPKGDKVGASCALCHTITDGSVFNLPNGGSIGHRQDGRANHNLNLGAIFATAANTRAMYPLLQLTLKANGGKTLGRAPSGLTETSTEAEVDAYFSNPKYYPVGMFDDSVDGNGDPMHNTPLFRQDLAAPFGSEGSIARLDNFSNLVYTGLLDLTNLTTPGGRAFLHKLGGAAGDEIADSYVKVLADTNVTGYPYVKASPHPQPGSEDAPLGIRVDNANLLDLNAYLVSLQSPPGAQVNARAASHGRELFRMSGCTSCHNVDQGKPVPAFIVPMKTIFPGDDPKILAQREPPLNPVQDTPGVFFDDKMAVVNASLRGEERGIALPLLLDLARKPVFLHDNSVPSLDDLLDPKRGAKAPHPFFVSSPKDRNDMVEFLRGLDTNSSVNNNGGGSR